MYRVYTCALLTRKTQLDYQLQHPPPIEIPMREGRVAGSRAISKVNARVTLILIIQVLISKQCPCIRTYWQPPPAGGTERHPHPSIQPLNPRFRMPFLRTPLPPLPMVPNLS